MSHSDAFHTSLALIDHLAILVPRIALHDHKLARAMRSMATAIPHLIAAAEAAPLARAHKAAGRIHIMLDVVQAWGYVLPEDLSEARDTARRLHALTAPA
jgi:hypothetical protein